MNKVDFPLLRRIIYGAPTSGKTYWQNMVKKTNVAYRDVMYGFMVCRKFKRNLVILDTDIVIQQELSFIYPEAKNISEAWMKWGSRLRGSSDDSELEKYENSVLGSLCEYANLMYRDCDVIILTNLSGSKYGDDNSFNSRCLGFSVFSFNLNKQDVIRRLKLRENISEKEIGERYTWVGTTENFCFPKPAGEIKLNFRKYISDYINEDGLFASTNIL